MRAIYRMAFIEYILFRIMYIMLNSISKTVACAMHLVPQLDTVNLDNCIHAVEYANEHNIRYAEIYARNLSM